MKTISRSRDSRNSWHVPSLEREFETAVANVQGYSTLQLQRQGIGLEVPKRLPSGKIEFFKVSIGDDFYVPRNQGFPVFVIATGCITGGRIEDLVVFTPDAPRWWRLRTGDGYCLGEPGSSVIHDDIAQFLRSSARGCLPLKANHG